MSLLISFFSLERFEGEPLIHLYMRMTKIYHEIPLDIMPPYVEFIKKFFVLGVSPSDPDLKLIFQIIEEGDGDKEIYTKVIQEHNDLTF